MGANHYTGAVVFDIGFQEMVLIAVLVIVFIPADDLPEMMRTLGRYYAKIRRASDDLRRAFNAEVARTDAEKRREDLVKRRERAAAQEATPGASEKPFIEEAVADPDPDLMAPDPQLPADAAPKKKVNH